ncbi:hypothetical protein [Candidatus Sororendozoicomonas aggregata]
MTEAKVKAEEKTGDGVVDAVAAVVLILTVVATAVFWLSNQ